ncbi:MAG: hypothetical protein QNJ04_06615 [Desulfobacterales bacterium]|nr:hypothetical protein [Desulfobacterales bacterium]
MKTCTRRTAVRFVVVFACMLFTTTAAMAAPVFETIDYINGIEGLTYSFDTGPTPGKFEATLSDLSFGPLAFEFLGLSISTASQTLGTIEDHGTFHFSGMPETTYYANIFGVAAGDFDTGLFGVQVEAVPLPPSLVMIFSGLLLIVVVRRQSLATAQSTLRDAV